jgi:hypothetical protein
MINTRSSLQEAGYEQLDEIQIEGRKISFKIVCPGAPGNPTFSGEPDESGKTISGDFSHGGATGTFSMEKE